MKLTDTSDLWWKTAVVYCLDVETFLDWNGDGIGDLAGLVQRIDYLAELGVTCLWLMPIYPTPDRDDGYDVIDFYGVDPRLGNHGDLVELIRTAQDRGIRVIVDLVVNHTSDKHPWFKSARSSPSSPYRDWYVWSDDPPPTKPKDVVFPDQETSVWTYDEKAGSHYLHRFYRHQPDLNVANPRVRDEVAKVVGFWLELGVSGFRVDAVPFFIEHLGISGGVDDELSDPHRVLRELRSFLTRRRGESILLGEVNLPHEGQLEFFGGDRGDELTMLFDFIGMQKLYLSLAREDAGPLAQALLDRPAIPRECQWATFVRNHDELTLDKLSDDERQEVFDAFGPEPEMQIYGRGLRRRLPPMLDGDPRRIRMVYS
ncbi:MAG: alpha-amylase family glycosyl hydrolase, partial [Acidimicrobiales bacterium]